ncbi:MAG: AAA family ATPase [Candidatus Thorarchaeota archaeon]
MSSFLLALCGLPASGKTTFAHALRNRLNESVQVMVVSTDDLRDDAYYRDFRPEREHQVRRASLQRVATLIKQGISVIVDDTNYYTSMRHNLMDIARSAHVRFGIIHISTPLDVALLWNRHRVGSVPDHVVERIAQRFDPPGRRYSWDIPLLDIDLSRRSVDDAVDLVIEHLDELSQMTDIAPVSTGDELSVYDVITRHVVTAYLVEHPEQRGTPRVSQIRRKALRLAIDDKLSREETESLLRRMLDADE